MRYIFMDEAGTSAREPVTIVVGVIADADRDLLLADSFVQETLGGVPEHLRSGFVFHAMQVLGDKKYQTGEWSLTDRLEMLYGMMSVPRKVGMAITFAAQWRGAVDTSQNFGKLGLSAEQ